MPLTRQTRWRSGPSWRPRNAGLAADAGIEQSRANIPSTTASLPHRHVNHAGRDHFQAVEEQLYLFPAAGGPWRRRATVDRARLPQRLQGDLVARDMRDNEVTTGRHPILYGPDGLPRAVAVLQEMQDCDQQNRNRLIKINHLADSRMGE